MSLNITCWSRSMTSPWSLPTGEREFKYSGRGASEELRCRSPQGSVSLNRPPEEVFDPAALVAPHRGA